MNWFETLNKYDYIEDNVDDDTIIDAYEDLLKIMEANKDEDGNTDFPDALSEVTSIHDLNKDEVEALKEKYDDDCNNYKGF